MFISASNPFGGNLWSNVPKPPLGDYLIQPFNIKIRLLKYEDGDNLIKFSIIDSSFETF